MPSVSVVELMLHVLITYHFHVLTGIPHVMTNDAPLHFLLKFEFEITMENFNTRKTTTQEKLP